MKNSTDGPFAPARANPDTPDQAQRPLIDMLRLLRGAYLTYPTYGLCWTAHTLRQFGGLTGDDQHRLLDWLDGNLPEGPHTYNWPKGDTAPRIAWLDAHIKRLALYRVRLLLDTLGRAVEAYIGSSGRGPDMVLVHPNDILELTDDAGALFGALLAQGGATDTLAKVHHVEIRADDRVEPGKIIVTETTSGECVCGDGPRCWPGYPNCRKR